MVTFKQHICLFVLSGERFAPKVLEFDEDAGPPSVLKIDIPASQGGMTEEGEYIAPRIASGPFQRVRMPFSTELVVYQEATTNLYDLDGLGEELPYEDVMSQCETLLSMNSDTKDYWIDIKNAERKLAASVELEETE